MKPSILVKNVGKRFRLFDAKRPTTFIESFVKGFKHLRPPKQFKALDDVNFDVSPGKMIGIIGKNGAGKSTLLRLVGGVGRPDQGVIKTNGRIGALLELGADFHPDLTGRENVYINGVIAGLTRAEVKARFDDIVAFAELEAFIDNPLRTYSTGMEMRLAFSVAAHIEPDILLIDEVLAVGDVAFQQKCLNRIAQFKKSGCTILLVSHDIGMVESLCDEVIWLKNGRVAAKGDAEIVVRQYLMQSAAPIENKLSANDEFATESTTLKLKLNENRFGTQAMQMTSVEVRNEYGRMPTSFQSGDPLTIYLAYEAPNFIVAPIFIVTVTRDDGLICMETSTVAQNINHPDVQGKGEILLSFERLDLINGRYFIDVGIYSHDWETCYDYHYHVYPLTIHSTFMGKGIINHPTSGNSAN